jgi:hypothetical protein
MLSVSKKVFRLAYANDLDAFIPELWANESILILVENMVASNLVHRDFESSIASFGDIVNTRKPAEFTAARKTTTDDVTVQDATAENIQVPLNQHWHTSFMIRDGEESKSFKQLRDEYLVPAVQSLARAIDQMVLGQVYQFLSNAEGHLGLMSDTTVKNYLLETRKRLNINKCYENGRNLIWTPSSETEALKLDWFVNADKVGDDGTALREASLGRKFQFSNFMCQNTPSLTGLAIARTTSGTEVDLSAGYAVGETTIHVDGTGGRNIAVGQFFKIEGDEIPHQVTATANLSTDDVDVTFTPALKHAVADNADLTFYKTGLVNQAVSTTGYAAGWSKEIVMDGLTGAIEPGSMVRFADVTNSNLAIEGVYCVLSVTNSGGNTIGITLDRPLVAAIDNNDIIAIGPGGDYNFAFHRNALALVCRPLAPAPSRLAISATQSMAGVSMRVTVTYNGTKQGVLVTVDLLTGIATLDTDLGAVMLG